MTLKLETAEFEKLALGKQPFDKKSPGKTGNQQNEKSRIKSNKLNKRTKGH